MKPRFPSHLALCLLTLAAVLTVGTAWADSPTAIDALKLTPVQGGVDYDKPDPRQAAKCTISVRRLNGRAGWVVEDPNGLVLRIFVDNNGDQVVDQWSYFKDGLEVYRDIDSNFNRRADQCRWFNTAGTRWGVDENEDGRIDRWKVISAEEVTAEVIAALAAGDTKRFARLVPTASELESLGLGRAKAKELSKLIARLEGDFTQLAKRQKSVRPGSKWLQFSGNTPGTVPADTEGSTKDLRVYENVMAVVQTDGRPTQVQIGTLVEIGPVWRVISLPRPLEEGRGELAAGGFFFHPTLGGRSKIASAGPSEAVQKLLGTLEEIDGEINNTADNKQRAVLHARRAELLQRIAQTAGSPKDRAMWLRQMADMISAAVQSDTYPAGVERLKSLFGELQKNPKDKNLAAYVKFRLITAEYGRSLRAPKPDFQKIQTAWLESLEKYVQQYPTGPDTAEAMLQLAMTQEFAGEEDEAKKWYARIVKNFAGASAAHKAAGAARRLDSVGKRLKLQGKSHSGDSVDLADYRGKVVLVQYWATWCEPAKSDMPAMKELLAKYGRSFGIIGVNLDSRRQDLMDYLAEHPLPWPQIFEQGGLDSRPANELGIITVPTMILIDRDGKVVRRAIDVAELDRELRKLIGSPSDRSSAEKRAQKRVR